MQEKKQIDYFQPSQQVFQPQATKPAPQTVQPVQQVQADKPKPDQKLNDELKKRDLKLKQKVDEKVNAQLAKALE